MTVKAVLPRATHLVMLIMIQLNNTIVGMK